MVIEGWNAVGGGVGRVWLYIGATYRDGGELGFGDDLGRLGVVHAQHHPVDLKA